jgi:hypothetical protein
MHIDGDDDEEEDEKYNEDDVNIDTHTSRHICDSSSKKNN